MKRLHNINGGNFCKPKNPQKTHTFLGGGGGGGGGGVVGWGGVGGHTGMIQIPVSSE